MVRRPVTALLATLVLAVAAFGCGSEDDGAVEAETGTSDELPGGFVEVGGEAETLVGCFEDGGSPKAKTFSPGKGTGVSSLEDVEGVLVEGLEGEKVAVLLFKSPDLSQGFIDEFGDTAKNNRFLVAADGQTVLQVLGQESPADETLEMIGDCIPDEPAEAAPADEPQAVEEESPPVDSEPSGDYKLASCDTGRGNSLVGSTKTENTGDVPITATITFKWQLDDGSFIEAENQTVNLEPEKSELVFFSQKVSLNESIAFQGHPGYFNSKNCETNASIR